MAFYVGSLKKKYLGIVKTQAITIAGNALQVDGTESKSAGPIDRSPLNEVKHFVKRFVYEAIEERSLKIR